MFIDWWAQFSDPSPFLGMSSGVNTKKAPKPDMSTSLNYVLFHICWCLQSVIPTWFLESTYHFCNQLTPRITVRSLASVEVKVFEGLHLTTWHTLQPAYTSYSTTLSHTAQIGSCVLFVNQNSLFNTVASLQAYQKAQGRRILHLTVH